MWGLRDPSWGLRDPSWGLVGQLRPRPHTPAACPLPTHPVQLADAALARAAAPAGPRLHVITVVSQGADAALERAYEQALARLVAVAAGYGTRVQVITTRGFSGNHVKLKVGGRAG